MSSTEARSYNNPLMISRQSGLTVGLAVVSVSLIGLGLVAVTTAGASLERSIFEPSLLQSPLGRHGFHILLGLLAMVLTAKLGPMVLNHPKRCRWIGGILLAVTIAALALTMVPGFQQSYRGSQRWLRLHTGGGAIGFQPSEFAKISLVFFLAWWLGGVSAGPRSFKRGFLPALVVIAVFVALVGKADFGTAALIGVVGSTLLAVAGCRKQDLLLLSCLGAVGALVLLKAESYRMNRFDAYWNLWEDPRGASYQPVQSLIAINNGGWTGIGLGAGFQKYGFLPESRTDFIFSTLCEETGAVGALLVLFLFAGLTWLGLKIMRQAPTPFHRLLAFGLTSLVALQALLNIAVATVLVPPTGIPLPFISAGGSSMVAACASIGLLMAVAKCTEQPVVKAFDWSDSAANRPPETRGPAAPYGLTETTEPTETLDAANKPELWRGGEGELVW